jgi:hypothetical protein|tara:strand:+ start:1467 stop:2519 length:1053 start_codon:yes stop_codon:yes gene_type:complete
MATDILGLLTGVSKQGIDPMLSSLTPAQQRMEFGRQSAQGMQQAVRGLMGGSAPIQEQIQAKALEKQLAGSDANYNALVDLGLQAEADRYKAGGMTDAQANSLINNTRASRIANQKTQGQRLNYLAIQGFTEDDPLYALIQRGVDLTDSQFSSLVNQEKEARNPNITVTGAKIMNVEQRDKDGNVIGTTRQRVGQWKIGKTGMPIFGYLGVNADGQPDIIPVTADQVSEIKDGEGLDPTVSDIKSIKILMETAGEEEKGTERWGGIFSTDWNDAWNRLTVAQKHHIATFIAEDAMRLNKGGMEMSKARKTAIKDYLDTYLHKTGLFELGESTFREPTLEEKAQAAVERNQ